MHIERASCHECTKFRFEFADYRSFITLVRLNLKPYFGVSPRRRTRACVAAISNRLDYSLSRVIEERYAAKAVYDTLNCR